MNLYEAMLALGPVGLQEKVEAADCKYIGDYIEKLTGHKGSGGGIMNGGLMLDSETIDVLKELSGTLILK